MKIKVDSQRMLSADELAELRRLYDGRKLGRRSRKARARARRAFWMRVNARLRRRFVEVEVHGGVVRYRMRAAGKRATCMQVKSKARTPWLDGVCLTTPDPVSGSAQYSRG